MDNVLAISSYGAQRVKNPHTGQVISAYKMGYSSAASAVLLTLYGDKARDVSSKHASYHYIQIDGDVVVRHGYILLKVSDKMLHQAETVARSYHRAAVFLWRDGKWRELPNNRQTDYSDPLPHSGPDFNPSSLRLIDADSGEKDAAVAGITVEKSQRDPNEKAWFWLMGDTYPHRELLKRCGCRWSKKRRGWYYIGWALPPALERLVEQHRPSETPGDDPSIDDDPCSVEEAAQILGMAVKPVLPRPIPDIRTAENAVVPSSADTPSTDADITRDLIESGKQPEAGGSETEPTEQKSEPETTVEVAVPPADEPKIRIIKPQALPADGTEPDAVQSAIQQVKAVPRSTVASPLTSKNSLIPIPQQPVGELTGSITGSVWCYGYSLHENTAIYINLGGPRMAVEAIRARLSKGEIVNCVPWDAPAVELTAGEGNTGMYTAYLQSIPEAKFTSLILVHELVVSPNYGGKSTTFIFRVSDAQAIAQIKHHVTELVKVPVFDEWADYLYTAGQAAMLVRKTRCAGGLDVLVVELDLDAWTRLITGGLDHRVIVLPYS